MYVCISERERMFHSLGVFGANGAGSLHYRTDRSCDTNVHHLPVFPGRQRQPALHPCPTGHEQTRGLFIDDRDNGYGATGITDDWSLPANAINGFGFFEYFRGDTETYHRVMIPDILAAIDAGRAVEDPPALDVRHAAWPGMDKREIELQILARRQRAIEDALRRAREKKAREERERRRRSRRPAGGPRSKPKSRKSTGPWRSK